MAALRVDLATSPFLRMVLAEFSFCCKYGQKRSGKVCGEDRHESLPLHAARQATMAIFRRFHEQRHNMMQALHTAARMKDGERLMLPQGDHPLYAEIRRDLGLE
jgi:hypothetical protein